jgi:hypothetical protein
MTIKKLSARAVWAGVILAGSLQAGFGANVGSPQSVNLKIYEFWVSANADCSGLTRVYNESNPSYQNMVTGPTFGSMTVPNGTYPCIAWRMSDVVTLVPDYTSDGGQCVQGVTYTRDLFRPGDVSISPDGATINGSGAVSSPIEDFMWIYLSTGGNNTTNSGTKPTEPGLLGSPYIVSANNNAILVTDFTNGIEDTGGSCSPETVSFSFRYQ